MASKRSEWVFPVLAGFLILAFAGDLLFGSVRLSFNDFLDVLSGKSENQNLDYIIWSLRLPKAITAVLAGSGLALCGLLMQTLFRNPLAGPFVLGISSGASLGVALLVMASSWFGGNALVQVLPYGHWGMVIAAMAGALAVMLFVILISVRVADSVSILIIGMMFGSATGAIVSLLQYFSDPDTVKSFLVWTFGDISGVNGQHLKLLTPLVFAGIFAGLILRKPLNALLLGENHARVIGVNVKRSRIIIILITSLLTGAITAFTGPIAFVGVAVPHLARAILRTSDHRRLTPATLLCGAIIMLICDILAQLPASNQVLPINTVTAIFGAPVVIWVILRNRRGRTPVEP
jgi:iron complex transport system permease protein